MSNEKKMWGGRFSEKTAASVEAFSASIHYDSRLYRQDIAGSKAHAKMLAHQGLISAEECERIIDGLTEIGAEIAAGTFVFRPELEDIHMNIEKALADKIGDAGARLHTARSRNDQINLDTRLYMRQVSLEIIDQLSAVQKAFVGLARTYLGAVMPGYTHLQRAQPVLISHHMLAYHEMFGRDKERLRDGLKRINVLPLGEAALAGTGLPIDRDFVARELDFPKVSANSMDTVADRDFIIEFCSSCAMIQIHLSRLSEELVLWSSEEFKFVELADAFCTGSSIMPQKKNPDIPELIRGKSGRVVGNLMGLLTLLKGLPMTYNRDLQEDKEPLFDTIDTVQASLAIMAELLVNMTFYTDRLEQLTAGGGFMTATDLADYLVRKNVPFRQAHAIVGETVAYCIQENKDLPDLSLDELRTFSNTIDDDVFAVLSVQGSVNSRLSAGGTALQRVEEALLAAEQDLGMVA
ncbi:MAG: argininosuccinate lyase [Desulfobulbaceae bacterium]|nr:MAG: argininosuccinate lyase [Desulfobulbaceae bacterium]